MTYNQNSLARGSFVIVVIDLVFHISCKKFYL